MDDEKKSADNHLAHEVALVSIIIAIIGGVSGLYFMGLLDWYRDMLSWLYLLWSAMRRTLEIITILLSLGLVGFIFSILRRFYALREKLRRDLLAPAAQGSAHTVAVEREAGANWEEIRALADSANPSDWNMAVLRADALLDDVLGRRGYAGTTIAERLQIVDASVIPSVDMVRSAHRIRNMIAHDPLQQHTRDTIIHALRSYEAAFKELGVIGEVKKQ